MSSRPPIDEARWQPWVDHVAGALQVASERVSPTAIHELTSIVAADFQRPMAPVAAYIWGLAVAHFPEADPVELRDRIVAAIPES